jgi:hypothetical protein
MTTAMEVRAFGAPGHADSYLAADAVRETCDLQLGLTLRSLPTCDPATTSGIPSTPSVIWYRSGIDLTTPGGRWRLTLVADAVSARRLAQRLYALDPDEEPGRADIADALKELVNIAAGVFKRERQEAGLRLELPVFAEGWSGPDAPPDARDAVRLAAGPLDPQIYVLLGRRQGDDPGDKA